MIKSKIFFFTSFSQSYLYSWCLVASPSLTCYIGVLVPFVISFELIISEHSNSPARAFKSGFTSTAYCSVLRNRVCRWKWKRAQRKEGEHCLPACMCGRIQTQLNSCESGREQHKQSETRLWECCSEKGEQPQSGEGVDFAVARLEKQTVIPRRDKKESQNSARLKPTVKTVQSKSNWWGSGMNY